jgi:hypothetical protein
MNALGAEVLWGSVISSETVGTPSCPDKHLFIRGNWLFILRNYNYYVQSGQFAL